MRAQHKCSVRWNRIAVVARVDGSGVRILLPRIGHLDAMAEEALVAGDVLWYRLVDVSLGG